MGSQREGLRRRKKMMVLWGPSLLLCRFLGRRHDDGIHGLRPPASEKRQGTKSREVGAGGAAGSMAAE